MAAPRLVLAERELGKDRRRLGRPGPGSFAPEPGQPFAQLPIARLAVEDSLDHELRRHSAVPAVLFEPKGNVESLFLPETVELAAKAERDRAARIVRPVLDPETQMLAVSDSRDVAELTARHEQGDAGISEPEGRKPRELSAEVQRQLGAVHECIDRGPRPQLLFRKIRIGVRGKGHREGLHLSGLDREPGRGAVSPEADEVVGAGGEAAMQVEAAAGAA